MVATFLIQHRRVLADGLAAADQQLRFGVHRVEANGLLPQTLHREVLIAGLGGLPGEHRVAASVGRCDEQALVVGVDRRLDRAVSTYMVLNEAVAVAQRGEEVQGAVDATAEQPVEQRAGTGRAGVLRVPVLHPLDPAGGRIKAGLYELVDVAGSLSRRPTGAECVALQEREAEPRVVVVIALAAPDRLPVGAAGIPVGGKAADQSREPRGSRNRIGQRVSVEHL